MKKGVLMKRWLVISFFFVAIFATLILALNSSGFVFVECVNGNTRDCPNQDGVCGGAQETCVDGTWPGCDITTYTDWAASQGGTYEDGTETLCDGQDNDCDDEIDGGLSGCLDYVIITPKSATIDGDTQIYEVTVYYTDGTHGPVTSSATYSSSNPAIAYMLDNEAFAVDVGSVTITATYTEGDIIKTDDAVLNVVSPSCTLNSVEIIPDCGADLLCESNEHIEINAEVTGACSFIDYIQIDAENGDCKIAYLDSDTIDISGGIGSDTLTIDSNSISASWEIPVVPAECLGDLIHGVAAALYYDGTPETGTWIAGVTSVGGMFTFIGSGAFCGDNVINPGEQCDGNLGGFDCSDFDDFTGGNLNCVNCMLDTSECTGGIAGVCGDEVINTGEQCDGDLDSFDCSDFDDFTGGNLNCVNCMLDTNECTGGPGDLCGNGILELDEDCYSCPDDAGCSGSEICYISDGVGECNIYDGTPAGSCNEDGICQLEESCDCSDCEGEQDGCVKGRACNTVPDNDALTYECSCDNQADEFCPLDCPDDLDCEGECGNSIMEGFERCEFDLEGDGTWTGCDSGDYCTGLNIGFTGTFCDCYTELENGWVLYYSRGECIVSPGERKGVQTVKLTARCVWDNGCLGTSFDSYTIADGEHLEEQVLDESKEKCTLPPEKVPFFTGLNILLVAVILTGYYLHKKKN